MEIINKSLFYEEYEFKCIYNLLIEENNGLNLQISELKQNLEYINNIDNMFKKIHIHENNVSKIIELEKYKKNMKI